MCVYVCVCECVCMYVWVCVCESTYVRVSSHSLYPLLFHSSLLSSSPSFSPSIPSTSLSPFLSADLFPYYLTSLLPSISFFPSLPSSLPPFLSHLIIVPSILSNTFSAYNRSRYRQPCNVIERKKWRQTRTNASWRIRSHGCYVRTCLPTSTFNPLFYILCVSLISIVLYYIAFCFVFLLLSRVTVWYKIFS